MILDDAGTGKSTCLKRVAHDYAEVGKIVLSARRFERLDVQSAVECLSAVEQDVLIVVDGVADHIDQLAELLDDRRVHDNITIVGAERTYRKEYIDLVVGEEGRQIYQLQDLSVEEYRQLIERYNQFGLVGSGDAVRNPDRFAERLQGEGVSVAVCRILNDFRPFDDICSSLWADASEYHRLPYLAVALAHRCHRSGLRYSVIQGIRGTHSSVQEMIGPGAPLALASVPGQDDFIIPANAVVAERLLLRASLREKGLLQAAFEKTASGIAPRVNRRAIKLRSPEARLARRLFDADKVVKPLLGDSAEAFYVAVKPDWEWNSRYWEQRALLVADADLPTALGYARHAVALEEHTFPMTTLATMLLTGC